MALKSYILTNDWKAPYVTATGHPKNPQAIRFKQFKKGTIIKAELKHANNKPAFLLVSGVCVVPLNVVKELVTKEIISNVDGQGSIKNAVVEKVGGSSKANTNPKVRYIDSAIIGAIVGFGGVILAEKQGWLTEVNSKYRLYGAIGGALLLTYVVYRSKTYKRNLELKKQE